MNAAITLAPTASEPLPLRAALRRTIAADAAVPLALALTLALVMLYSPASWYVRGPVAMAALAAFVWRGAIGRPIFWLLVTAVLAAGVYLQRFTIDNHQYLMAYWCGGIALSLGSADPGAALRRNARLLVGLTFGFAVAWKLASPEFVNGSFLEYEMLTDQRFAGFTELVAGLSGSVLQANRAAVDSLQQVGATQTVAALTSAPAVTALAQAMTWYTLVIEGWIALAFLLPRPGWLGRSRDLPLIGFLLTTYSVATVPGFAYLLIAMGYVQCERRRWWIPAGYLAAVFATQIFLLPLGHIGAVLGLGGAR